MADKSEKTNKGQNLLNRQIVKTVLPTLLTVLFAISGAFLGGSLRTKFFVFWLVLTIVLGALSIALHCYYVTGEYNSKDASKLYEKQNQIYGMVLTLISEECGKQVPNINKVIHSIVDKNVADLGVWSFKLSCDSILKRTYKILQHICQNESIEIAYVKNIESKVTTISLISYANRDNITSDSNNNRPKIYEVERNFDVKEDIKTFFDIKSFKYNLNEMKIFCTNEEILKEFGVETHQQRESAKKYRQFCAIPVHCDQKMVGLLEIAGFEDNIFGKDKTEIQDMMDRYVVPITWFLLLLYKVEKALIAKPKAIDKAKEQREII